ncbi:AzlD domain-containing protein [Kribbella sp. NPDC051587]|jgi:branched-subunit amino acid transport protein|uniref:AzlD domain-containing protein n=1 Tax=unclassified Kribbella TaxID=2644121 RepID=UPI0036E27678
MKLWLSALVVTVISWLMKASAPLAIGGRKLPPTVLRLTALTAPVLLAGLIITELGGEHWQEFDWTKVLGVGVAGGLCLAKVPMLLAVGGGIVVTALIRLAVQ